MTMQTQEEDVSIIDMASSAHQPPTYMSGPESTLGSTPCNQSNRSKSSSSQTPADEGQEINNVDSKMVKVAPRPPLSNQEPTKASELQLALTKSEGAPIYIEFADGDPENPFNWSHRRKALIAGVSVLFSASTAITGTGYPSLQPGVLPDLGCSETIFLFGNTLYLSIGISFTPLLLAPLSEMFGRLPIVLVSSFLFAIFYILAALTPNTAGLLLARFFQGCTGSVGNSLVGGIISDLYAPKHRGLAMSMYALAIFVGQGCGPLLASYTTANPRLGWRWCFGWQGFVGAAVFLLLVLFTKETRGSVLLSRRARKMTKESPCGRIYKCSADDDRPDFLTAVKVSLSRPAWWLISEPIVTFFSLWIAFLWGAIFLLLSSVPIVFEAYGWTEPQKSLVLLCLAVGAIIGWIFNFHQEKLYARAVAKAAPNKPAPEARLYYACVGGVLTPIGMFIFAWTGRSEITPAAPIIGLTIFSAATFWIYLAVFTYIAECYEIYASSGLAAQSWLRNVLGGTFPLFAPAMYTNLSPPIASTIMAVIAAVLGVCPFVLLFYGGAIRARSKVAKALAAHEEETRHHMELERERNEKRRRRQEEKEERQHALEEA